MRSTLSLLLLLPLSLFSQKDYVSIDLLANHTFPNTYKDATLIPTREGTQGGIGGTLQGVYHHHVGKNFFGFLGLGYSKYNYRGEKMMARYSDEIIVKGGYPVIESDLKGVKEISLRTSANYMNIPLGIAHKMNDQWQLSLGVNNMFLLSSYNYSVFYYDNKTKRNYDKKSFTTKNYSSYALNSYLSVTYQIQRIKLPLALKFQAEYAVKDYFVSQVPGELRPFILSLGACYQLNLGN